MSAADQECEVSWSLKRSKIETLGAAWAAPLVALVAAGLFSTTFYHSDDDGDGDDDDDDDDDGDDGDGGTC